MKKMIMSLFLVNMLHAAVIPLPLENNVITDSVSNNEEKQYKITVPAGKTLKSAITNLEDDADVYVRIGAVPTGSEYDCRSANSGTNDDGCSIDVNNASDVFVTVYGYHATNYTLTVTIEGAAPESVTDINLNQVVTSSVAQGKFNYYKVSTNSPINAVLNHLSADADVYVKVGQKPTQDSYDCHSTHGGTSEDACIVEVNQNSDVYIGVYGYRAANYQLVAQNAQNAVEVLTSGTTVTGTLALHESKAYKISVKKNENIKALLSNLSADLDLYVKVNGIASRDSYDFRSVNGQKKDEHYEKTLAAASEIYLTVYAYQAGSYSLVANVKNKNDITVLGNNAPHSDSIAQGEMTYYKIAGSSQYTEIKLDQLTADLDLYVKVGEKPTVNSYDARSANGGTKADYSLLPVDAQHRDVYIGVYGYRAGDYRVTAKYKTPLAGPTVYEDAEGGSLNPNWQRSGSLSKDPILVETPDIPGAPEGEGSLVLVPHPYGYLNNVEYTLETNNYTQTILSVDCGGLPNYLLPQYNGNIRYEGYIVHYTLGVNVETLKGTRKMHWYSFFNHKGTHAFISGNGYVLNYPSPVETTSGYYKSTTTWNHFQVDLNEELQKLEPDNKIYKVNYFYASGGFLDNIQLSTKN